MSSSKRTQRVDKLTDDQIKTIIDNYEILSKNAEGKLKDIIHSVYYYYMWSSYILSEKGYIAREFKTTEIIRFRQENNIHTPIPSDTDFIKLFNEFIKAEQEETNASANYDKPGNEADLYKQLRELDKENKYRVLDKNFKEIENPKNENESEKKKLNELATEYHRLRKLRTKYYEKRLEKLNKFEEKVLAIFKNKKERHILPIFSKKPQS